MAIPDTFDEGAVRLIGANQAVIDVRKVRDYAFDSSHARGQNKARVFQSALGINRSNYPDLIVQIQQGIMDQTPVPGKIDRYGYRFVVEIPVMGPGGSGTICTGWIYRPGSLIPDLVTLFVR